MTRSSKSNARRNDDLDEEVQKVRSPKNKKSRKKSRSNNSTVIGISAGVGGVLALVLLIWVFSGSGGDEVAENSNPGVSPVRDGASDPVAIPAVPIASAALPADPIATNAATPANGNPVMPVEGGVGGIPLTDTKATVPAGQATTAVGTAASLDTASSAAEVVKSLEDLIEEIEPCVVRIDVTVPEFGNGTGSGFVVDSSGIVVTNYHVIEGGSTASVVFSDGGVAAVLGFVKLIPEKDIAILKIDYPPDKLKSLKLAKGLPRKGEAVIACGAPLGLSFTFSEGIISAHRPAAELFGEKKKGTWVQTTTPISPGNSGGPLINMHGEVVAMNTITIAEAQNLNFGISSQDINLGIAERSMEVTGISPVTVPMRPESQAERGGRGAAGAEIVDVSKDELGKELLGQLTEMNILAIRLNYDPQGELSAYLRRQSEVQCKKIGITITDSDKNLMIITMQFNLAGTSKGARAVRLSAQILMAHEVSPGQPKVYLVWEKSEEIGIVRAADFAKGKVPDTVRRKAVAFFKDQFGRDYKTAQEFMKEKSIGVVISADKVVISADKPDEKVENNKNEGAEFLDANGKKEGVKTLASGLQYEVISKGNGPSPKNSDRVKVHYHGTLIDGTVFDSSVDRDEPTVFAVNQVIKGWTEALQLMKVGDKWRIVVPAELAYGPRGAGKKIGPHATLIFEIELLGIEKRE